MSRVEQKLDDREIRLPKISEVSSNNCQSYISFVFKIPMKFIGIFVP